MLDEIDVVEKGESECQLGVGMDQFDIQLVFGGGVFWVEVIWCVGVVQEVVDVVEQVGVDLDQGGCGDGGEEWCLLQVVGVVLGDGSVDQDW